jgi:hypothetical protein
MFLSFFPTRLQQTQSGKRQRASRKGRKARNAAKPQPKERGVYAPSLCDTNPHATSLNAPQAMGELKRVNAALLKNLRQNEQRISAQQGNSDGLRSRLTCAFALCGLRVESESNHCFMRPLLS